MKPIQTIECRVNSINEETGTVNVTYFYSDNTTFTTDLERVNLTSDETIVEAIKEEVKGANGEEDQLTIIDNR